MKPNLLFLFLMLNAALSRGVLAVQADPPGFAAVPKEKLDGLRLVLRDANCSLAAPGAEWKWLAHPGGANFMCFSTRTGQGFTVSAGNLVNEIDDHTRTEIMDGVKKSAAAQKSVLSNEKFEKCESPIPGKSWRLSYLLTLTGNAKINVVIYVVNPGEHSLVTLQDSMPEGRPEFPAFKHFVASLKTLK